MNFGPRKIVISIAAIPAIRICAAVDRTVLEADGWRERDHSGRRRRCGAQLVGHQLEADRARALDQDRVARLDHRLGERDRRLGVGAQASGA